MSERAWGRAAGAVIAVALTACAGGGDAAELAAVEAEACTQEVDLFVAQLQAHVDRYHGVDPLTFATEHTSRSAFDLPSALTVHHARLTQLGCDPGAAAAELTTAMDGLRSGGAVASSIAEVLRASVAGRADAAGQRIEVGLDDDLASLALSASPGSVLVLAPGEHQVEETVLVAQQLTIVGQDRDTTTIVSTADEVALLVAGSGALELSDLTLVHDGGPTDAVVLLLSPWYDLRDLVVTGARADDDEVAGTGAAGVLLARGPAFGPSQADVVELDGQLQRVEVHGNDGPGIAIQGDAAPRIVAADVHDNGPCGVCYLGSAGGSLTDSLVRGNEVGVLVGDTSDPQLTRTRVQDNLDDGILVEARAAGSFRELEVTGNGERGVMVTGEATPSLEDVVVRDNGEVGIALIATVDVALVRTRILGHLVGLWVGDEAVASLVDSELEGHEEAAVVLRDAARATGHGNRCRDNAFDVVTFDAARTELEGTGCAHQPG